MEKIQNTRETMTTKQYEALLQYFGDKIVENSPLLAQYPNAGLDHILRKAVEATISSCVRSADEIDFDGNTVGNDPEEYLSSLVNAFESGMKVRSREEGETKQSWVRLMRGFLAEPPIRSSIIFKNLSM